jgi:hypothetical protein
VARKIVEDSGNTVRLNRDDLRAMCFNSKWSGPREKFIIAAEKALAKLAIDMNYNAVIDDTNLSKDIWTNWAKENGVLYVANDLTGVSIAECIARDSRRTIGRVGPGVIYRLAAQGGLLPWSGRPIVICDIDGTIADLNHRLHYIQSEPRDYEAFFSQQTFDTPIEEVIGHVKFLSETHDIVMVSGRPDNYSHLTVLWLKTFFPVNYVGLLMRRAGDHRPDDMIKQEILALLPKERIVNVVDDRPNVCAMWERNGLSVTRVNQEAWIGKE